MDPAAVAAVLAGVDPAPLRLMLYSFAEACGYGSRARGDARPTLREGQELYNAAEDARLLLRLVERLCR